MTNDYELLDKLAAARAENADLRRQLAEVEHNLENANHMIAAKNLALQLIEEQMAEAERQRDAAAKEQR